MFLSNYNKLIGTLVGGTIGMGVSYWGLPADWNTPEMIGFITMVISAIGTYLAPPNTKV